MPIVKYTVLNPLQDNKKPYYDIKRKQFIFPVKENYKWFLEAAQFNVVKNDNDYFILIGTNKFDDNCKKCEVDMYGKCKLRLIGELKEYVIEECNSRGNIKVEYIESTDDYDVFSIE